MININRGTAAHLTNDDLLSEEEVASMLGIEAAALKRLRYDKKGPPTIKVGRVRRIRREALREWLKARET